MSIKGSRLLYKYFAYYVAIMLVIILAVGLSSYAMIRPSVTKGALDSEYGLLNSFAKANDTTLSEILNLSFTASEDNDFVPHIINNLQENADSIMGKLKSYIIANNYITDLYLISPNYVYIYSPRTTYTMDRFLRNKLGGALSEKEFAEMLSTIHQPEFPGLINIPGTEKLMCVAPLPSYDSSPYAYLIFELPRKNLGALAAQYLTADSQAMVIADGSQIIAYSTNTSPETFQAIQKQIMSEEGKITDGKPEFKSEFNIQNVRYLCIGQKTDAFGWRFIRVCTTTHALQPVKSMLTWFMIILLLSTIIGSALVYVMSYINVSPIRKLNDLAKTKLGLSFPSRDELASLEKIVTEAGNSIGRLQQNMEDYKPALKHLFIMNMIRGEDAGERRGALGQYAGISLYPTNFFVAIFHIQSLPREVSFTIEDISTYIDAHLPAQLKGYTTQNIMDNKILAVMSAQSPGAAVIKGEIESLRRSLWEQYQIPITVGVGGVKAEAQNISNSFLEASAALDYQFILGKNTTICFYDLNIDAYSDVNYPHEPLKRLLNDLTGGREDRAMNGIRQLMEYIRTNSHTMHVARLICYDIANSVLKTLQQMDLPTAGPFSGIDPITLTRFETLEELEDLLTVFCRNICGCVNNSVLMPPHMRAIEYIRRNYADPNFTVNAMADEIGVSTAHLSRSFRENIGVTIADYVRDLKIEQAKVLLTQTGRPISKIVYDLGYCDVSSFIRTFKANVGVTPGEYRANMKAAPNLKNK